MIPAMEAVIEYARMEDTRKPLSRRLFVGAAAFASAGLFGAPALAQTRAEQLAGRKGNGAGDPGPENKKTA